MHGCPEDMPTWTQLQAALDAAHTERDSLAAELAKREADDARHARTLSVLRRLLSALPERLRYEHSAPERTLRLVNALADAEALVAEVEGA